MRGKLDVIRIHSHFIRFILSLPLHAGEIDNLTLYRRAYSSVTIDKMTKENDMYLLDYIVPLHALDRGNAIWAVDDMISIQQYIEEQEKPRLLGTIRMLLSNRGERFLCVHDIPLDIQEHYHLD